MLKNKSELNKFTNGLIGNAIYCKLRVVPLYLEVNTKVTLNYIETEVEVRSTS